MRIASHITDPTMPRMPAIMPALQARLIEVASWPRSASRPAPKKGAEEAAGHPAGQPHEGEEHDAEQGGHALMERPGRGRCRGIFEDAASET